MLRWQNDQGRLMRQEFTAVSLDARGSTYVNEQSFADWLLQPAIDAPLPHDSSATAKIRDTADRALNQRLAKSSGKDLFPASCQWVAGARVGEG
jgi:hypothetical protein